MAKFWAGVEMKTVSLVALVWSISACTSLQPADLAQAPAPQAGMILTDFHAASDVSPAARATRPERPPEYDNVRSMLENADMSAFMEESRRFYADGDRSASWGFAAIDMIAAGEAAKALTLVDEMPPAGVSVEVMSPAWLRPWALAAAGKQDAAIEAMEATWLQTPQHLYRGHRALLLEGMGRIEEAIEAYKAPDKFDRPDEDAEPSVETVVRALTFGADRILALRQANLLEKLDRDDDARKVYDSLLAVDPSDAYVELRIKSLGEDDATETEFLTLPQALAMALNDEASGVEERQMLASVLLAKGAEAPFNHFVSALRQSALLLDPKNASVRELEVDHLYEHGFFEAAARMALSQASDKTDAELQLAAAEAKLELGHFDEAEALVGVALDNSDTAYTKLQAVEVFIRADAAERATQMVDLVLDDVELEDELRVYALLLRSESRQQAGDMAGAVAAAREAYRLDGDSENTQAFLASVLTLTTDARSEGLALYRRLIADAPNNSSMMNNYGYSLVRAPDSAEQLDEGFRLLKRANRQAPFEPNLLDSLGWAYYQYGDFKRARHMIEQAIAGYAPFSHWELFDHLGDVQWRQGETDAARESWKKAMDARPPLNDRVAIETKIKSGMTAQAPEKRTPPLVPADKPVETTDI